MESAKLWLQTNKRVIFPTIVFLLLTIFAGYRFWSFGAWVYPTAAVLFGGLTVWAASGKLPGNWQSNMLNLGISFFFLDLVFAQLPLQAVGQTLLLANWWLLIPSLIALAFHLYIRIWRWQWLLRPLKHLPYMPVFRAGMIGIGGNMVLPAKAGEFLRAYVIGRSSDISKTGAFATVVVERIFDGLTVLTFLVGVVLFVGISDPQLQYIGLVGAGFYLAALAGVVFYMLKRDWFEWLVKRLLPPGLAETILSLMRAFADGLESLRNPRQLAMVTLLSFLTWAFIPLSFHPIMLAFHWQVTPPFFISVLLVPVLALALSIPSAPGGVGAFEWAAALAITLGFQVIGAPIITQEQQVMVAAAAVLLHISQSVPEALIGMWAFFAEGLTTGDLQAGRMIDD